ncbi:unnamed protein product, partial [Adineta steineri]
MSSSSVSDGILKFATQYSIYSGCIIFSFGIIGNVLNLLVFTQLKQFRTNRCAFYITIESISNFIYQFSLLSTKTMLTSIYGDDATGRSFIWCKLRYILGQICTLTTIYMICFTVVDQFFSTNHRFNLRQMCTLKLGRYVSSIFICFAIIHSILLGSSYDIQSTLGCVLSNYVWIQYSTYFFYPILIGFLPIIIASSFSILAYHNVRHIVRRQLPIVRRKLDKQITAMVLTRVIAFVCLTLPYNAYRIYAINFPISRSMPMAYAIGRLVQTIFTSISIINYVINFYIFIIFSSRFRRQARLVLVKKCWQRWKYWCCSINNRIEPDNNIEARLSINQPKLCPSATWNSNAVTFTDQNTIGTQPYSISIDINNTIYISEGNLNRVQVWLNGNGTPIRNISNGLNTPQAVFPSINGDIYVDNGNYNGQVDRWALNAIIGTTVINTGGTCYGLFIDINNYLYCSILATNKVIKQSLDNGTLTIAAGNGTAGNNTNQLRHPRGIFIDTNLNMYVADSGNARIQLFKPGQSNATTVAGTGAPGTFTFIKPIAVILDSDGYLFIADFDGHCIIRSGRSGFYCLFGCTYQPGAASNQLHSPQSLSFDSYGNLYVADSENHRIQKFIPRTNSCDISYNLPKFCSNATWNPNAINLTYFINNGVFSQRLFINNNNTVYMSATSSNNILVWLEGNASPQTYNSPDISDPGAIFVTVNGAVYVYNNGINGSINKWAHNGPGGSDLLTRVNGICNGIFVDIEDNIYCSMSDFHTVLLFNNGTYTSLIIAGNGSAGSGPYMLNTPRGIFVDINLNLYIADCRNNRVQLLQGEYPNMTTVVGNGSNEIITFDCPTSVILDADGYLFILDSNNQRIVGSNADGYRCIVGCINGLIPILDELYQPWSLSFDSYGNIYVDDAGQLRLQKFLFISSSCGGQSTSSIFLPTCSTPLYIGSNCNTSASICDIRQPCQNNSTCINDNTIIRGYNCYCLPDFNGTECQYDYRICQLRTCSYNGICYQSSNTTFTCSCNEGWQGVHCEIKINYCKNITC